MHLNAGVSASGAGADDSTFIIYRLPLDYPDGANPHTDAEYAAGGDLLSKRRR